MNSGTIPIVKFMFEEEIGVFNQTLSANPSYQSFSIHQVDELVRYLSTVPSVLIIAYLRNKEHFAQIATFMKLAKQASRNSVFKIVVFNFTGDNTFAKGIIKLGIQDQIEPYINCKGLKFKIDFWMKALRAQERTLPQSTGVNWLEPLALEDDIWILKSEQDCKKILNRWLIKLTGPGPFVAQWIEVKSNVWRFDFKESDKEMYLGGKGAWFFSGEARPEFVWKENSWLIAGDNFELFYQDEDKVFSRLKSLNKNLKICKNSLYAKTKEPLILEQLEKEVVFKTEVQKLSDLEGKGSTTHSNGFFAGEAESGIPETDFWKNRNTYEKREGNLIGKIETDGESSEQSYWKNQNTYERKQTKRPEDKENQLCSDELEGHLSGKINPKSAEALDNEYKERLPREKRVRAPNGTKHSEQIDGFYRGKQVEDNFTEEEKALHQKIARIQKERKQHQHDKQLEKAEAVLQRKLKEVQIQSRDPEEVALEEITRDAKIITSIFYNNQEICCELDDLFDEMIILRTQDDEISVQEILKINLVFNDSKKNFELSLEANVLTVDSDGEGMNYITCQINKFNVNAVKDFMKQFESRQNNINQFFKSAKGF